MNKLLNYKTKTKNATPPIFTEIVALFFFTNCQRWDYISSYLGISSPKWRYVRSVTILPLGVRVINPFFNKYGSGV